MSRFNTATRTTKTTNLAGGEAFKQSDEMEFVSILLTSFVKNQYYRSQDDVVTRVKELINKIPDKEFLAKTAIYARRTFGMRTITHIVAAELAPLIAGTKWAQYFYNAIVFRPDDMLEIWSYCEANNIKHTHAMRKGFQHVFRRLNEYSLTKYVKNQSGKTSLIDLMNYVHPTPKDPEQTLLWDRFLEGKLKPAETWETGLVQAGQKAKTEEEKEELKKEVWVKLIKEKKLGYFAGLRNIRNVLEQAPEVIDDLCDFIRNEKAIKSPKNLVFPFRYATAFEVLCQNESSEARKAMAALSDAVEISLSNIPKFEGRTLVAVDGSGSMTGNTPPYALIALLFGVAMAKSNECDLMAFERDAQYVNFNTRDSVLGSTQNIYSRVITGGSTNFQAIFDNARHKYDRIFIFSDMQAWVGYWSPAKNLNDYKNRTGANPHVYCIDLAGYGSLQFPERQVYQLAGFSEKIFDTMKVLEKDKNALINEIKETDICQIAKTIKTKDTSDSPFISTENG